MRNASEMSAPICAACGATMGDGERCAVCGATPSGPPPATRDPQRQLRAPSTVTTPQQRRAIYWIVAVPMLLAALGALVSWCARSRAPTQTHPNTQTPAHAAPKNRAP